MRRAPWIVVLAFAFVPSVAFAANGPNLVANPSFTTGIGSWTNYPSSNMTTDWDSASHAARANWIGATTLNYEISAFWQNNIPVTAGATYTFSGRMSVTVSAGASRTASIGVSFYDASNNNLLFSTTPDVPENAGFVSASRTVVAPANAATVHVVLYVAETTGCVALFDDIYFGTSDPVPTVSFTATPSSISSGQSSTLNWSTQNATSVSINNGIGAVATNGSRSVSPASTTTYTLTATGAGGTATKQVTVVVTAPLPTASFTASPQTINAGSSSTLTWTTQNATSVSIDNGVGSVATSGSRNVSPARTTTYTLTANGAGGTATKQATVTVVAGTLPTIDLRANPDTILAGQSSMLSWTTTNATSATLNNGIGTVPVNGSRAVSPAQTTIYTLTARGSGGTSSDSVTVTVAQRSAPVVEVTDAAEGMVQVTAGPLATDQFAVSNLGDTPTVIHLSQSGSFFTQSPSSFTLEGGRSQIVTITATQQPAGNYDGASIPSGNGVPNGLRIPIRLLVTAPPNGVVTAEPNVGRVEVSGPPGENPSGSVTFRNTGSVRLQGIAVADAPWLVPEGGPIAIGPGDSVPVHFTIDRSKRSDAASPLGAVSTKLSLVYPSTGSTFARSCATAIDVAAPASTASTPPPLGQGELAIFVPVSLASRYVGDIALSARGVTIDDLRMYLTSPDSAPLLAVMKLAPNVSVPFPAAIRTLFHSSSRVGSIQIRTGAIDRVSVTAVQANTGSSKGYISALPVFRSDEGVASGSRVYLAGLDPRRPTLLYVQEVAGSSATVQVDTLQASGTVSTTSSKTIEPFGIAEISIAPSAIASIRVANTSTGGARIVAHAFVTDGTTDDRWLISGTPASGGAMTDYVPVVPLDAPSDGTTELNLFNPNTTPLTISLDFVAARSGHRRGVVPQSIGEASSGVFTLTVQPLHTDSYSIHTAGASGHLRISASAPFSGSARGVITTGGKSFGTAFPMLDGSHALSAGQSMTFNGVESASNATVAAATPSTYRAGVGLIETAGAGATVKLTLRFRFNAGYVSANYEDSRQIALDANASVLLRNVREILAKSRNNFGDLRNMELEVTVVSGAGRVVPYLVTTDNSSGDVSIRGE